MNIEKLKAARNTMPDGSDINDIGDWAFEHRNIIRTLLDQAIERSESATAINAPDLSELRKEFTPHNPSDLAKIETMNYVSGWNAAIDHLAPRIVMDGMVAVPETVMLDYEARLDMIRHLLPLAKGYVYRNSGVRSTEIIIEDAEAMIAASKED